MTFDVGCPRIIYTTDTETVTDEMLAGDITFSKLVGSDIVLEQSQVTDLVADLADKLTTTLTSGNIFVGNASNIATEVAVTGDLALSNTGVATLDTVNSDVGSFGSSTQSPVFTVNAKGLITAVSNATISGVAPSGSAGGDLSSTYPNPTVSKINGVALGSTTATSGNLLIGSGTQWVSNAVTGDITINSSGVTAIGSSKVTNTMLAGSIAASKLVGTDIATVGTVTAGTWSASFGAVSGANLTNLTAANISAGTAGINISGNAGTATILQTARNINGTSFNGSADITITAAPSGTAGGDLSSTYPNPTVSKINGVSLGSTTATAGNLLIGSGSTWATQSITGDVTINSTGVTTIGSLKVTNGMIANSTIDLTAKVTGVLPNANTTATSSNTASTIVARDASGNFSAGTITAALSGNSTTATTATNADNVKTTAGTVSIFPFRFPLVQTASTGYQSLVVSDNFYFYPNTANLVIQGLSGQGASYLDVNSSDNETGLRLSRFSSSGYAQVHYKLDSSNTAWSTGLRSGDNKYHIFDVVNGVDGLTITAGANPTVTLPGLTASQIVLTDSSKNLTTTGTLSGGLGGTNNSFMQFTGPATSLKTYTLPNATTTILTTNAAVTEVQGGTNQTTYAQGDLLYASASNTLSKLAKDTNATRYLSNTGTSNNPAWSQINLTNGVTGVLPNANTTAASANTASAIVSRDSNGDFSARTITMTDVVCANINNRQLFLNGAWTDTGQTVTITGTSSNPTYNTSWSKIFVKRLGDTVIMRFEFERGNTGTAGSGDYLIALPSGYSFASSIPFFSGTATNVAPTDLQRSVMGHGHISNGSSRGSCSAFAYDSTRFRIGGISAFSGYAIFNSGFYQLSSAVGFAVILTFPVDGFADTQRLSSFTVS